MRKVTKVPQLPNTRTQRWLRVNNACLAGRLSVGAQTLGQFFMTTHRRYYLRWILERSVYRDNTGQFVEMRMTNPELPSGCHDLRLWATAHDVHLPLGV
jgi:hypothetical protein